MINATHLNDIKKGQLSARDCPQLKVKPAATPGGVPSRHVRLTLDGSSLKNITDRSLFPDRRPCDEQDHVQPRRLDTREQDSHRRLRRLIPRKPLPGRQKGVHVPEALQRPVRDHRQVQPRGKQDRGGHLCPSEQGYVRDFRQRAPRQGPPRSTSCSTAQASTRHPLRRVFTGTAGQGRSASA